MEQKCSLKGKVISLHLQRCWGYCPNASSCYHMKKEIETYKNLEDEHSIAEECIRSGATVHDSVCSLSLRHIDWLEKYANYNVTLSCFEMRKYKKLYEFKNQIQVTVYEYNDLIEFIDYQKLFLIKNLKSFLQFCNWIGKDFGRLHFLLDQAIVNETIIQELIEHFNDKASEGQTLDSCLTSYLVNGECPYKDGNYIDITYDGTVRSCPYARKGNVLKAIELQFGIQTLPDRCKYKEYFGGKPDEQST